MTVACLRVYLLQWTSAKVVNPLFNATLLKQMCVFDVRVYLLCSLFWPKSGVETGKVLVTDVLPVLAVSLILKESLLILQPNASCEDQIVHIIYAV